MKEERPWHPVAPLRGEFAITAGAVAALEHTLPTFRGIDRDHEGIAYLCGREIKSTTLLLTTIVPNADHGWGHVRCSEQQIAEVSQAARGLGLGVLAQVHSHPEAGTEHSVGDDQMVLMPFEGMLSIVAPHYGRTGLLPLSSLGIHQFQDGRWVLISSASAAAGVQVLPGGMDLR